MPRSEQDTGTYITELEDKVDALSSDLAHTEVRRVVAQGKADTYKLELQALRKAREKGRRANRTLRSKLTELEARLYRLTNR